MDVLVVTDETAKVAIPISDEDELSELVESGRVIHDYDIFTARTTVAFDGERWLIERPTVGPQECGRS